MGECEPEQREPDRHDLRAPYRARAGRRARCRTDRGTARGTCRPDRRSIARSSAGWNASMSATIAAVDQGKARGAKRSRTTGRRSARAGLPPPVPAPACRPAQAAPRAAVATGTELSDRPRRYGRSTRRRRPRVVRARPQPHRVVGHEAVPHRERGQHQRRHKCERGDRRGGESRASRPVSALRIQRRAGLARRRAASFPRRTDRAAAATAPCRRRSTSAPNSRTR